MVFELVDDDDLDPELDREPERGDRDRDLGDRDRDLGDLDPEDRDRDRDGV